MNTSHQRITERAKRLKQLRNMSGISRSAFAKKCHLSESTLKYWETAQGQGLSEKGAEQVVKAIHALGIHCELRWLLYGQSEPPQFLQSLAPPVDDESWLATQASGVVREIQYFRQCYPHSLTMLLVDDKMEPRFQAGDALGGPAYEGSAITQFALGKDCILELKDQQKICRRLMAGERAGSYHAFCINPGKLTPLFDLTVTRAAPITRIWRAD